MTSSRQTNSVDSGGPTPPQSAREWLDALSSGACDQTTFLRGVAALLRKSPDNGWELLSLIDQYFRRGKLSSDTFATVKRHVSNALLGPAPRSESAVAVTTPPRVVAPEAPRAPPPSVTARPATAVAEAAAGVNTAPPLRTTPPVPAAPPAQTAPPVRTTPPSRSTRSEAVRTQPPAATSTSNRASAKMPAVGDVLRGRYRIDGILGQGGMGTVFEAVDLFRVNDAMDGQRIAIKVLHTEISQRPHLLAELRQEFQHLQALSHPNIVRVHEYDRDGDLAFFTMEQLQGMSLNRLLLAREERPLQRAHALAVVRDVGAALAHAHSRGVVHGDLNPGNVFINDEGEVRVLDFGAANTLRSDPWISEFEAAQQRPAATPTYASCQVLEGAVPDARDDVFGFACVIFVLLSGTHPFQEQTALQARSQRLKPKRPGGLSHAQWTALKSALDFDRDRRPADLREWLKRFNTTGAATRLPPLMNLVNTPVPKPPMPRWIAPAAIILILLTAGGWFLAQSLDLSSLSAPDLRTAMKASLDAAGDYFDRLGRRIHKPDLVVEIPPPDTELSSPNAGLSHSDIPPPVIKTAPSSSTSSSTSSSATPPPTPTPARPAPVTTAPTAPTTMAIASAAAATQSASPPPTSHSRIELAADTVEVAAGDSTATIVVKRSGSLRSEPSFQWWTESGTAKPGQDFTAVKAHAESMVAGKNTVTLTVPVVADMKRKTPRSFYVLIDEATDGATIGARTVTMVTLNPPEE